MIHFLVFMITCVCCHESSYLTMFNNIKLRSSTLMPKNKNMTSEETDYIQNIRYPWEHEFEWLGIYSVTEAIEYMFKNELLDFPFGFYNQMKWF